MTPQEKFFQLLEEGYNIFLTGPGGTGKTYLLKQALEKYPENFVVTSSTGISAVNLMDGAVTIHSFSGLGIRTLKDFPSQAKFSDFCRLSLPEDTDLKIKGCKKLIIDEVSMLSPEFIDSLDILFKIVRNCEFPFGGVQMIFSGDMLQLPPVVKTDELTPNNFERKENFLAFESKAWQQANIQVVQLTEIKRTDNLEFAEILCRVRTMDWTAKDFKMLKSTESKVFPDDVRPLKLFNSNRKADQINKDELDKLPGNTLTIKMKCRGPWEKIKEYKKGILAPEVLELKENCRVMVLINKNSMDSMNTEEEHYVNGSLGTFLGLKEMMTRRQVWNVERDPQTFEVIRRYKDYKMYHVAVVRLDTGHVIYLKRNTWEFGDMVLNEFKEYQPEVEISQFPIRLAYAFTIHKSQGMSIDSLEIDCHGIRTDNQFYVAASRARSFEGLKVVNLKAYNITACPKAIKFYKESLQ